MKNFKVYMGNIRKCTKYRYDFNLSKPLEFCDEPIDLEAFDNFEPESEIYKKDVILVKIENNGYKDIDHLRGPYIDEVPSRVGGLFIEKNPILLYDSEKSIAKLSVKQLKKELGKSIFIAEFK